MSLYPNGQNEESRQIVWKGNDIDCYTALEHRSVAIPALVCEQRAKPITIRLADSDSQRNSATMLLNKMYSWRGYGDAHVISGASTHTTFTASAGADTVGTITLAVDSAAGLAADRTFKAELDGFRASPDARICELTKLAFDASVPSKPLLASMFHLIFIYGHRRHGCTDLFIEVNPRHVRFYQVMLGFDRVGDLRENDSVGAPSQLMWLKVSDIRKRIDEFGGKEDACSTRSLYPFFFSPREEDGLLARMLGSDRAALGFPGGGGDAQPQDPIEVAATHAV